MESRLLDNLDAANNLFKGSGGKRWTSLKSSPVVRLINDSDKIIGKIDDTEFPDKAGGIIQKLDWKNGSIDKSGISNVKKHLSRLSPDSWNDGMIKRLEDIEAGKINISDFDKRFYTHELTEFERFKQLGYEGQSVDNIPEWVWENAHAATLEDFQLHEIMQYDGKRIRSLYHPSVQID